MKWEIWRELRKCNETNSPGTNWEKVTLQYRSSLHKYRSCRKEWIIWVILKNFDLSTFSSINSFLPAEIPGNFMDVQLKLQISELQFEQIHHTFVVFILEDKIQHPGNSLFRFSFEGAEVEMVESVDDLSHRAQIKVIFISRILKCWTRELLLLWTRSSRILTSRKRSVWRNRKLRKKIGSFAEDRSLTWSTTIFESLVLMIPFLIMLTYSISLPWRRRSGIRYEMGWNSIIYDQDPTWWCLGKFVQVRNTWVWSTQNRMRIVRHGNSSQNVDAWRAEVENDGEEKHRSEILILVEMAIW